MGCGCGVLILLLFWLILYFNMRETVWSSFETIRFDVESACSGRVPENQRKRLVDNLDAFRKMLEKTEDPYPVMGAFVRSARMMLQDGRIDSVEVDQLNTFCEAALRDPGVIPDGP